MKITLHAVKICDPHSQYNQQIADLIIENGIITDIQPSAAVAASIEIDGEAVEIHSYDLQNMVISPGFMDVLADYSEPGYEHKETISTGLACAAAGGYTNVLLAPNTQPAITSKSGVQYVLQQAKDNLVTLSPYGTISRDAEGKELAEMLDMRAFGAVSFTDGWKPVQNANLMLKALEYVKAYNGVLVQLPVDTSLSAGGLMHEGIVSTRLGMPGIPDLAETLMVHRDIELVRYTGSKLHITGVSLAASVEMIRKAKADGLSITCSVTPYHLALNDEILIRYESAYKVTPPLRPEADRLALIEALADGTIDCIASHHRPQDWDAKTKEFEYAQNGMNLQENAFQIVYEAVKNKVSLERLVEAFAIAPRRIFNIPQPAIEKGNNAELAIFAFTDKKSQVYKTASLSANNPFAKNHFTTVIAGVINNGKAQIK